MTILGAAGISLAFGTEIILEDITFSINEGDRVGVVGQNGAGKTSLFRILAGDEHASSGSLSFARGKSIAMLRQNAAAQSENGVTVTDYMYAAVPRLTALEAEIRRLEEALARGCATDELSACAARLAEANERFDELGGRQYRSRCDSLLTKTGFDSAEREKPVSALSGGQKTRLALARILFSEPDLLLLDEPTNHLDADTLSWLETYLAAYRKTLLVVSHDRYFLDRVTSKTLFIYNRRCKLYPGNYSKTEELRDAERAFEEKRWKLQQKEIARIRAHIEQQRSFGRERNFVTIASREKALARMEKYERPDGPSKSIRLSFTTAETGGNDVLTAHNISMAYEPANPLFRNVDLEVKRGERVFIVGGNGTGKSTFMRILCGKLAPVSGTIYPGVGVRVAYYDQENHGISESNAVFSELSSAYPAKTDGELRTLLGAFLFRGDDVFKPVAALSGGERCRLALAKMMWSGANLLLLDEPTNHLDIASKEALEAALEDFEGTLIAVSHDRYFIDRIATRIFELLPAERGGALSLPLTADDGYDTFRDFSRAEEDRFRSSVCDNSSAQTNNAVLDGKADYERRKEDAARRRREEKLRAARKTRIATLETELPLLEKELYSETTAADYTRCAELQVKLDNAEAELLSLYEEEENDKTTDEP